VTAKDVLTDLHRHQEEIHMGKMAEEKGATADMREYGKTLRKDHASSDQKVMELAVKEGLL